MTSFQFTHISSYKFIELVDVESLCVSFKQCCEELELTGTVIIAPEGMNLMLAGTSQAIEKLKEFCGAYPEFSDLWYKEIQCKDLPFKCLFIKHKEVIIPINMDEIKPATLPTKAIEPLQLKAWYDEGREFTVLDIRNHYEIEFGAFEGAIDVGLRHFRHFPQFAAEKLSSDLKSKPLVMYCTGGIRCEKAGPALERLGYTEVYQLEGGIVNYFDQCGTAHYQGDCYVFDERVSLNGNLEQTGQGQCEDCQGPVLPEACKESAYQEEGLCENCV